MELTLSIIGENSAPLSKLPSSYALSSTDLLFVSRPVNELFDQALKTEYLFEDLLLQEYADAPDVAVELEDAALAGKNVLTEEDLRDLLIERQGIQSDSLFLIEDQIIGAFLYDDGWKLTYSDLSAQLLKDVAARLGLKSMAFREDWQHSLRNHDHPYSGVLPISYLSYQQVCAMYSDKSQCTGPHGIKEYLGTVEVYQLDGEDRYVPVSTDIYMPHIEFPLYAEPDIGEVRFLAVPSLPDSRTANPRLTSVYSDDDMFYDVENEGYWVYPKGQTIRCGEGEFRSACSVYGPTQSETDGYFTVPDMDGLFVKPYPGNSEQSAMLSVKWRNGLIKHSDHRIDNDTFKSASTVLYADVTIPTTEYWGDDAVHSGGGSPNKDHKVDLVSADVSVQNIKCQNTQTERSDESLNVETRPKSQCPVTIVYIGRRYSA